MHSWHQRWRSNRWARMAQAAEQGWAPLARYEPLPRVRPVTIAVPAILFSIAALASLGDPRYWLLGTAAVLGWTQLPSI